MAWTYVLGEENGETVKIGWSRGPTPWERVNSINGADARNERWLLLAAVRCTGRTGERAAQRHFADEQCRDRGRQTEYFRVSERLTGWVLWLRAQHMTTVDPGTTEPELPHEEPNTWLPREGRTLPPPPEDPNGLFGPLTQLTGHLAGSAWDWMPDPNASHQDYFTPPELVGRAWEAMGGIDLDAASHFLANKRLVSAGIRIPHWFTAAYSAFDHPWHPRVWLNPPYGDNAPWFRKIAEEFQTGRLEQLCMLSPMWAFTTGLARPHTDHAQAMIVLNPTPKFHNPANPNLTGSNQPHAIVYWGGRASEFIDAYAEVGIPCRLT